MKRLIPIVLLLTAGAAAQSVVGIARQFLTLSSVSGACTNGYVGSSGGNFFMCVGGAWTQIATAIGSTSGSTPAAGYVGEVIASTQSSGSPVSLTSTAGSAITSISLTAGNWDIAAIGFFAPGSGTSVSFCALGIGFSSTNLPAADSGRLMDLCPNTQIWANITSFTMPMVRLSVSSTTTIYLVADATFTVSTLSVYGTLTAKRTP